jgi:hypothetical protein
LIFGGFKLKKNLKLKKILTLCGTAFSACRRAARRQGPGAVLPALVQEIDSYRRAPRRQGLYVVGCDGRSLTPWATASDVHLSKFFSKIMKN